MKYKVLSWTYYDDYANYTFQQSLNSNYLNFPKKHFI